MRSTFTIASTQSSPAHQRIAEPEDSSFKELCGGIRNHLMIATARRSYNMAGADILPFVLLPWLAADILRRLPDYKQFRRLRSNLPRSFWRGGSPLRHYIRMIAHWQKSLALCILANELTQSSRRNSINIRGTPPNELKEWDKRPVVIACLHTGGFALLRHWFRARGIVAASLLKTRPEVIRRYEDALPRRQSNAKELPRFFHVNDVRAATRFLAPGRVLIVAIEAQPGARAVTVNMGAPLRVNDGAARLARLTGAMLVPASVWVNQRLDICFGTAVPRELIDAADTQAAMNFLAREFWNDLAADPCAIGWTTLEAYAPEELVRARTCWP